MKTAICAIARNENHYIKEWCDYHLKLGFDNITIFDNNDVNGERIETEVGDFGISVKVDHRFRGKHDRMHQSEAYTAFYKENHSYDWIAYIDIDEFIHLEQHNSIKDFLNEDRFKNIDGIRLCWMCFTDNNLIKVENNNYSITRFTEPTTVYSTQAKTIIRGNLKYVTNVGIHTTATIKNAVDALGHPCWNGSDAKHNVNIGLTKVWECAWINHYRFKTLQEFIDIKLKNWTQRNIKNRWISVKYFFDLNKKTPEKINYLKSRGIRL